MTSVLPGGSGHTGRSSSSNPPVIFFTCVSRTLSSVFYGPTSHGCLADFFGINFIFIF